MRINVLAYPDVEAALDAADDGDAIYFPGVKAYRPKSGTWLITRSLEVYGDGPGTPGASGGTILEPYDADTPLFTIKTPARNVHIHDLELRGPGGSGTGVAILCQSSVSNQTQGLGLRFRGLAITGFASHGIHLDGYNDTTARIARVSIADCLIEACGGAGIQLRHAFEVFVEGCMLRSNQRNGLSATNSGVGLYQCVLDGNALLSSWTRSANPNEGNVKLEECVVARVDACWFLNLQAGAVRRGCVLVDSGGAIVGACAFEAAEDEDPDPDRQGIVLRGTQGPVAILSNRFTNVEKLVIVEEGVRGCVLFPQRDMTDVGAISLPHPNQGMFGAASIQHQSGNALSGMILPSGADDPGSDDSHEGMLFYNATGEALRAFLGGQWRTIGVA